tara:strand:+ start:71 stop:466 length:396 start_codon:yes stop_codon:yes gene_type:complete
MSWRNILKQDDKDDIENKLIKLLDSWLDRNANFEDLQYMAQRPVDIDNNEDLVADVEFENNSERDLGDEQAFEEGEGFFIIQIRTDGNEQSRQGNPYKIARYNFLHDEGIVDIEPVSIGFMPIEYARRLVE